MLIRALEPADAPAFGELRVRALRDHPGACGRAPEEVDPVEVIAERFRRDAGSDFDFALGAFEGEALVGMAGGHRESAGPGAIKPGPEGEDGSGPTKGEACGAPSSRLR